MSVAEDFTFNMNVIDLGFEEDTEIKIDQKNPHKKGEVFFDKYWLY